MAEENAHLMAEKPENEEEPGAPPPSLGHALHDLRTSH